ncbi:MAG: VPLPA-CTERM sorting domain-containing protein [Candidatus Thiodiazotropha sp. (ex. Lucinisca nassula)]|nr:VPLPA-CTERM sorting domain-containing protein [Candidatus Thiodiazotropha sp. (ex. Lucinisca nassula)]MBW9270308.1 VPLPA-CTERM sorting domain-containing protein [Candidatus Thiodiazotropha sp. (ex. Lucinisca nassula)]
MKKLMLRTIALMAILMTTSVGIQAASYDAGVFSAQGDRYATPQPIGNFLDSYSLTIDVPSLEVNISGTHEGMFQDDLLLTNLTTNEQFHLGNVFSETFILSTGDYIFTLSGFALNALDPKIGSDYDLTMSAVPLPAAGWLFAAALIGFVSYSRRVNV